MGWFDIFPHLGDEQIDEYSNNASSAEKVGLEDWFEVSSTIGEKSGDHILATSLFWKNPISSDSDLPPPTESSMRAGAEHGYRGKYEAWSHYVEPLLAGAAILAEARPDIVFRVYLAFDLEFLVPELVAAGCEIKLMKSSSVRHNPGAMWRFLALEDGASMVTIIDADRAPHALSDIERTEITKASGLGCWRRPYVLDQLRVGEPGLYRPINACQFGVCGVQPISLLMKAFIWHSRRGTIPDFCLVPEPSGIRNHAIAGSEWPSYGFDEWFLLAALYPRIAEGGVLTFIPMRNSSVSPWIAADIGFVSSVCPASEVFYFHNEI